MFYILEGLAMRESILTWSFLRRRGHERPFTVSPNCGSSAVEVSLRAVKVSGTASDNAGVTSVRWTTSTGSSGTRPGLHLVAAGGTAGWDQRDYGPGVRCSRQFGLARRHRNRTVNSLFHLSTSFFRVDPPK